MTTVRKPVVLCVDDDPSMLAWMGAILSQTEAEIRSESSSVKALEMVRTSPPDVILLDINMPGMDGYQLCEKLQERPETSYIPVIFVTSMASELDRARGFLLGAVEYLVKPLAEETLVGTVRSHLATRRQFTQVQGAVANAPRETSMVSDPARWDNLFRSSGFSRFKEFLGSKLRLPADRTKALGRLTTTAVYSGTAEFGITGRQVAESMAEFLSLPFAADIDPQEVRLGILPTPFCLTNQVLALGESGAPLAFVVSNPFNWEVLEAIRRVSKGQQVPRISVAEPATFDALKSGKPRRAAGPTSSISELEGQIRREIEALAKTPADLDTSSEDSGPVITLVNTLIDSAYEMGASDIHIEPTEEEIVVRCRIDGDLHIVNRLRPVELNRRLIARLKVMSKLDLTEHRLPQDGRIQFKAYSRKNHDFDLRVAVLPVNHGEKACLRILDRQKSVMPLDRLGFSARNLQLYRAKIRAPYGMILHVGPTGSGKSMSLYAALNEVKDSTINVQTAEDPIEYTLPGINQLQVNPEIGLTFPKALRSFLRVDPDVILVGEIRDAETAKIAVEASLTGHLLLSTLHTNDSASTVTRLIDMGIEPYLVSSSLVLVCAQRLLRRLCPDCKEAYVPDAGERRLTGTRPDENLKFYRPRGCERCNNFGYKGRIAAHEIFVPNESIRHLANQRGVASDTLKKMAVEECGMVTLFWDAMEKVRVGVCSLKDALQNVRQDEFDVRAPWAGRPAEAARV